MAKLAKTILLQITPTTNKLLIDGEEFPFHIAAEDITLQGQGTGLSFARVSILAEQVVISADLGQPDNSQPTDTELAVQNPESYVRQPSDLGYEFDILSDTPEPDDSVLALYHHGDEYGFPYLVRHPDRPGLWRWVKDIDHEVEDYDPGQAWEYWTDETYTWYGATLKVVKVK